MAVLRAHSNFIISLYTGGNVAYLRITVKEKNSYTFVQQKCHAWLNQLGMKRSFRTSNIKGKPEQQGSPP